MPGTKQAVKSDGGSKAVEALLTSHGKRRQPSHVFSALFYRSHVKPLLNYSAYVASLAPDTEPMSEFAYRNSCIREAWEKAPSDIRQKVIEYKKMLDMSLEELEDMSGDVDPQGESATVTLPTDALNNDHTPGDTRSQGAVGLPVNMDASGAGVPALKSVLGGEASYEGLTTLDGEGLSGDTAISDKETSHDKAGNDPEGPLAMGEQAASMFNAALRETVQMKKMDDRKKYVFI